MSWLERHDEPALRSRWLVLRQVMHRLDDAESEWDRELREHIAPGGLPEDQRQAVLNALDGGAPDVAAWLLQHPAQRLGHQPARPPRLPDWTHGGTPDEVARWLSGTAPGPLDLQRVWRPAQGEPELLAWLANDTAPPTRVALATRVERVLTELSVPEIPALHAWRGAHVEASTGVVWLHHPDIDGWRITLTWRDVVQVLGAGIEADLQLARTVGRMIPLDRLVTKETPPWTGVRSSGDTRAWLRLFVDVHRLALERWHIPDLLAYECGGSSVVLRALLRKLFDIGDQSGSGRQVTLAAVEATRRDPEVHRAFESHLAPLAPDDSDDERATWRKSHERRALAALLACSAHVRGTQRGVSLENVFEWIELFDPDANRADAATALESLSMMGLAKHVQGAWALPDDGLGAGIAWAVGDPLDWLERKGG